MEQNNEQRAVFLDRDGTIIEEMGYINHFSRIRIFPFAVQAVRLLKDAGWKVVVVTNQAGVARGYFSETELNEMNNWMLDRFARQGAELDALYYCPHHPREGLEKYRMDCNCRKPKTGLIEKAAADLKIDVSRSWIVGDRFSDIELGRRAGMKSVFVLTGYGIGEYTRYKGALPVKADFIFNDVLQAAQFIVKNKNA